MGVSLVLKKIINKRAREREMGLERERERERERDRDIYIYRSLSTFHQSMTGRWSWDWL